MSIIENRYDFVLIFDVTDGNPNGDPDAGNLPRVDPETGNGLVTDVCLKRKVRNHVLLTKESETGYDIFVKEKAVLNTLIEASHEDERVKKQEKNKKIETARTVMCERFYDIRTFGAVLSTGDKEKKEKKEKNAGQVRGPVQLTFARSVDPIVSLEHSITVCAARKADKPIEKQIGIQGRKFTIPYGLYVARGFISAPLAAQTGFSDEDLKLFWEALANMFEHDRSAARGMMVTRKIVIFKHASKLGNAPAHTLFDRVKITRRDASKPTRAYEDYDVNIVGDGLPEGVEIIEKP